MTVVDVFGTFTISGTTADELRASLNRTGTIGDDGKRYDGYTRTNISWRFGWARSAAGCKVYPVAVRLDVHEMMPHWSAVSWAAPGLEARWKRYVSALQVHEDGHRQIALNQAEKVREQLEALPPQPTCDEAGAKANALGTQLLTDLPRIDREYDRATKSGETQGAHL